MKRVIMAVPIMVLSSCVFAFDMNPIDADCWGNVALCKSLKMTEKLKFPVHETMTLLAYDYYETPDASTGGAAKTSADVLKKNGVLRDLVLGAEWNDDPDSLLRQSITKSIQWYALFKNAKSQAECRNSQDAAKCKDVELSQNPMMLYRSHFGDLQFIHSMASANDEPAKVTKERMMAWAKFTYNVFTSPGNIENAPIDSTAVTKFSDISVLLKKPGWTVGALFDPEPGGEWVTSMNPLKFGRFKSFDKPRKQKAYENPNLSKVSTRYIALGSLLHMIQDSYSDSHTERENGCNPIARSKGKILSFRNYSNQDTEDHGVADVHPVWLENGALTKNNPLWASAKIIQFAFNKVPWDKGVELFLDNEVFPLVDQEAPPKPGGRECFSGNG